MKPTCPVPPSVWTIPYQLFKFKVDEEEEENKNAETPTVA
jgi:hypothetical protein